MHTIPLETDRLILRKFEDKDMQPLVLHSRRKETGHG